MNKHVFLPINFHTKSNITIRPYKLVECKYCHVVHTQHELTLNSQNKFKIKDDCLSDEEKIIKDIVE